MNEWMNECPDLKTTLLNEFPQLKTPLMNEMNEWMNVLT
jgi:hypothetical protein